MKLRTILESQILEKWGKPTETPKAERGKYKGKTLKDLRKMLSAVKKRGPHKKGTAEYEKQNELEFAIRAKTGWGKVSEARYHRSADEYDDDFYDFLETKWQEDYVSVYDALDGMMVDDDWNEQVQDMWPTDNIEDIKVREQDVAEFRQMGITKDGEIKPKMKDAIAKYSKPWEEFRDSSDAEAYRDDFHDQLEYRRDPYGYHGVSRRDFY